MRSSSNRALKLCVVIALAALYSVAGAAPSGNSGQRSRNSSQRSAVSSQEVMGSGQESPVSSRQAAVSNSASDLFSTGSQEQQLRSSGITAEEAQRRGAGCVDCHNGIEDMHSGKINIGCTDCHGGDASARLPQDATKGSKAYEEIQNKAHVQPRLADLWKSSANPERPYALMNQESAEFVRFVNPGDLRAAPMSCGTSECHPGDVHNVGKSMMATGSMLWGAALYNNGTFSLKNYRFGESYSRDGQPRRLQTVPQPDQEQTRAKGVLPFLDPLPRWEISQMGNILRTFERGGRKAAEVGQTYHVVSPGQHTQ